MAQKNYLQLINKVLLKLRESDATTPTDNNYTKLIGQFVNETKREVEDAYSWLELRSTVKVLTVASQAQYTLEGAGNRYKVIDVINDTEDYIMKKASDVWMNHQMNFINVQEGKPYYYAFNTQTAGDADVDMWPIPDAVYEINFDLVVPQEELVEADDILLVPETAVWLGAYAKALSERGEDSGRTYGEAMSEYHQALNDAIGLSMSRVPNENIWTVV